ncbi:MFS transporter [Oerskovia enterophila]|uniref:Nitrate/nitrite transporter NarK n=1 Tax=Oerskovia enterophila TaxID=43678 RepID=A0A163PYW0_9CELL|nr:MFS transporter [Oerskovia enterophila]KZM33646.1 nitrate/nitrite transporter NarK [Oerskovia enterophila]OCI32262.1 nitrate/nitrite transporter NarK [Oerskovia enterophila]
MSVPAGPPSQTTTTTDHPATDQPAPALPTSAAPSGTGVPAVASPHGAAQSAPHRRGRWIDHWDPEDPTFWRDGGRKVATRNLWISVFAEFLGFAVWALWSIVVPQLGAAGFTFTVDQQFWLIAVPSLVGATLRIPYTFAVPLFGGRTWTVVSALLLLVPTVSLAVVVQNPETPFGVMLLVAALAGVGGGNFASSMANISFFYPEKEKGRALGLNAAGGNLGTAAVQFAVPLVIVAGAGIALERAGLMMIPFILLAAFLAWRYMDNLTHAKADFRSFAAATRNRHTWIISFLYIGTFGSFIGYSGAFPTLLKNQFPEVTLSIAFLGALVGSVSRPLGGTIADKVGGARVTIVAFGVMALGAFGAIRALESHSFGLFFGSFLLLFVATGIGNGATYRMIPAVFAASGELAAQTLPDDERAAHRTRIRKAAAGCIGIAGAIGAFGGFLIPRGFAISNDLAGSLVPALWIFIGVYAVMAVVTWAVYQRRGARMAAAGI